MIQVARNYHLESSRSRVRGGKVKKPRYFLLYRRTEDGKIGVARILHDLQRHLPERYRRLAPPL